jgi:hypothetical protein
MSLLKPCKGDHSIPYLSLPRLQQNEHGPLSVPLWILQHRTVPRTGRLIKPVLLQCDGLMKAEATWDNWLTLQADYPSLNGEGNVTYANGNVHKKPKYVMLQGQMAADPNDPERRASRRPRV